MSNTKSHWTIFSTAVLAAVVYGGWAVYANYGPDQHVWLMAGGIQGTYAFISTLSITHVARWAFLKYKCGWHGIKAGFLMSFIVMLALPLAVHSYFGTPNIWLTIAPGLAWGSVYLLGFLISLDFKLRILPNRKLAVEYDASTFEENS